MAKCLLVLGLGTSVDQVALYLLLLYGGSMVLNFMDKSGHKGVDWGVTLYFSLLFFSVVVVLLNTVTTLFPKRSLSPLVLSLASLLYAAGWAEGFDNHPYRTLYLLALGLFFLWAKMPIDQNLKRLSTGQKA